MNPKKIDSVRIISISGSIASGSTTLAKRLSEKIGWKYIEGGEIFWEAVRKKMHLGSKDTALRPDNEDILFDQQLKKTLKEERNHIIQSHLAGFNAQGIKGVYKILVVCVDEDGKDQTQIRIDRLVNREGISVEKAKEEIIEREESDLKKWQKLYGDNDPSWTHLDEKYYDLVVNTYQSDRESTLKKTLETLSSLKH